MSLAGPREFALTLQRLQVDGRTDEQYAREELFDYFASQVLHAAPVETQEFLKCTALLPTVTGEMADTLLGRNNSDEGLEGLYRKGAFIDRRSARPALYQYHDLFRTFLLVQLESGSRQGKIPGCTTGLARQ